MQEKGNHSQPIGIFHKLFAFIMNSLIARRLIKRVSLGHPMPQDQELLILPNQDGLEIQVHYKQNDDHHACNELESWTQIDKLDPQKVRPIPISTTATSQTRGPKKVVIIEDAGALEKKKISTETKGKGLMSGENLTLAKEDEDDERSKLGLRRVRPYFHVAANINEKSDEFIRSRKEAMRKN